MYVYVVWVQRPRKKTWFPSMFFGVKSEAVKYAKSVAEKAGRKTKVLAYFPGQLPAILPNDKFVARNPYWKKKIIGKPKVVYQSS